MGLLNTIGLNTVPSWLLPFGALSSCPPPPALPNPPPPPPIRHPPFANLRSHLTWPSCLPLAPPLSPSSHFVSTSTPLCAGGLSNGQQERCSLALALQSKKQFDNFGGFVEPHTRRLQPYTVPRP